MSNYDERLVEAYLSGEVTLDDLAAVTGGETIAWGLTTRYVAMMRLLEKIAEGGKQ